MTTSSEFRTPPRILIPKLVKSRDAWKAKATTRKAQRKTLEIRIRDLEASRDLYKLRAQQLQQQLDQLQKPAPAPAPPPPAPKNSNDPAADTTTSTSSDSR
jgi:hypothetical protein